MGGLKPAIVASLVFCFGSLPSIALDASYFEYHGMCDASAAEALDANTFVVGNDEDNVLRVYAYGQPSPVRKIDIDNFLRADDQETDIEASAKIGNRIYWITSHGTNRKGKFRPVRQRFFATDITISNGQPTVAPAGYAYVDLLADLIEAPQLGRYNFGFASTLPPKAPDALNIEGLAATPDGKLLIGFRNPIPGGKALIVPIENANDIVTLGKKAVLGQPIELSLGGLGIRSLELVGDAYFIVAGPYDSEGGFALYRWPGPGSQPVQVDGIDFKDMHPEALFSVPGSDKIQILSDDGERRIGGEHCKDIPESEQLFRSITLKP